MRGRRSLFGFTVVLAGACTVAAVVFSVQGHATANVAAASRPWATRDLPGSVKLTGQVPLAVAKIPGAAAAHRAGYVRPHPKSADIGLSFAFPLRDKAGLDQLIAQEARTHRYLTRPQIYARFSPPVAQVNALRSWLPGDGFRDHAHRRRPAGDHGVRADGGRREDAARQDQRLPQAGVDLRQAARCGRIGSTRTSTAPTIPARFGVQTISGLSDVDRFFTSAQLSAATRSATAATATNAVISPLCVDVRSGGYFPADLRGALQHHGPRHRRHRPDDRLHALDGRREAGDDGPLCSEHQRPADHRRSQLRRDRATLRRRRAHARRRPSGPTTF